MIRAPHAGIVVLMLIASVTCGAPAPEAPAPGYRPTSTVRDIMDAVIDPSADFIWDSVQIVATLQYTEEHVPRTDEEWQAVRRHAVALVEASNLLLMPGRRIALPGEGAENPDVDLPPDEIQKLVDRDWPTWVALAHSLHDAASETLRAVEARDVKALLSAGASLDAACESCHQKYWYPGPANAPAPLPSTSREAGGR